MQYFYSVPKADHFIVHYFSCYLIESPLGGGLPPPPPFGLWHFRQAGDGVCEILWQVGSLVGTGISRKCIGEGNQALHVSSVGVLRVIDLLDLTLFASEMVVSTGMRTCYFYVHHGMPAICSNRNVITRLTAVGPAQYQPECVQFVFTYRTECSRFVQIGMLSQDGLR